jgi:hypothetical protein
MTEVVTSSMQLIIGIGLDASEMVYVLLQSCDRLFCPIRLAFCKTD